MFGLQKYKDIFGKPGKGVHRFRVCNLAIVDILLTVLLAKIIQVGVFPYISYSIVLLCTFVLGIFMHLLFGVQTPIQKFLFGK